MAEHFCEKCRKTMNELQFYTYKDGTKTEMCKKCLTMHIDNFNPDTFLWLLEKMDVPYIPEEWNTLRDRAYAKDPTKMNGMSVFGKYLSKMKLNQWNKYGWADTEKIRAKAEEEARRTAAERASFDAQVQKDYEEGKISEAEYKTLISTEAQKENEPMFGAMPAEYAVLGGNPYNENNFISQDQLPDPAAELTEEDKLYLAMKWGRLYQPHEWIELEKKYEEMMNSFDIQDSDTIGTLILICKTYLKMNQSIDQGDMDGYQKLSRVYDSLRKSAKFTAAQNKEQKSDYVDSVGELVAMCEKDGFIPRFATDIPQDKVDRTLKDMNNYLYKLVTQDLGFGQQIEDSLKKIQIQKEMNDAEIDLDDDDVNDELVDQDYSDYYESVNDQLKHDKAILEGDN
jgi:hypothetical protein